MKKISLFLVLCMLLASVCGCQEKDTNKQKYADKKSSFTSKDDIGDDDTKTSAPTEDKTSDEDEPTTSSKPTTSPVIKRRSDDWYQIHKGAA